MKRKIIILIVLFVFCIIENINVLENEINIQFDDELGTIMERLCVID